MRIRLLIGRLLQELTKSGVSRELDRRLEGDPGLRWTVKSLQKNSVYLRSPKAVRGAPARARRCSA
jgi:hypothetical protein